MKSILQVRNLTKIYHTKPPIIAVDDLSFDLNQNEILGLLGPNGSGKTTTIMMLLATLRQTSGSIFYFDRDFSKFRSELLENISFASTYTSLPYELTIKQNLRCYCYLYGKKLEEKKLDKLLERFNILDKKNEPVAHLSSGQITRLMLVKAFITDPKIVLLDEPTASLDPDVSKDVLEFILEQRKKTGISILFTSHKMHEVEKICDRVIFLKEGKMIANESPHILAQKNAFTKVALTIDESMIDAIHIVRSYNISWICQQNILELTLKQEQIAKLIIELVEKGIYFSKIEIQEPNLEEYFLKVLKKL